MQPSVIHPVETAPDRTTPIGAGLLKRRRARAVRESRYPVRTTLAQAALVALLALTMLGPAMLEVAGAPLVRQIGYSAVLVMAIVAVRPLHHPERLAVVPWPLLAALGWCWLSLLWALDPATAVRRLVLTTMILWSIFVLVRQLGFDRTLAVVRIVLAVVLVANYVVVLVAPGIGLHPATDGDLAGNWRGFMSHKNFAGLACALTVMAFAFDPRGLTVKVRAPVAVLAAVFLFLTDSKTSIGVGVAAVVIGGLFFAYRRWVGAQVGPASRVASGILGGLLLVVAIALIWIAADPGPTLELLSDPAGFTGRTQIWQPLVRFYADHPMLGAGYGSFWGIVNDTSPIYRYGRDWVVDVSQGHQGYLDLLVQIGAPGLLIVLAATFVWPLGRLFRSGSVQPGESALVAATILLCILHNLTESSLFTADAIGQVFLMLAIAMLWVVTPIADQAPGRSRWRTLLTASRG